MSDEAKNAERSRFTESVPEPPWRADNRAAPRAPLTREAVVDAAMRVLEQVGVDALSMRRVADELGTGPASLYGHVRNKEELLQLILERFTIENQPLPVPDPSNWQAQLKEFARQTRARMGSSRDIARISFGRIPSGESTARISEWLFELLQPAGIPVRAIALFADLMALYVGAITYEESLPVASPTGEDLSVEEIVEMFKGYFRSLPEDQFPYLQAALDELFDTDRDMRFEFGLDLLVRGLASYAGNRPVAEKQTGNS